MEKSFAPSLLEWNKFETLFRSEVMLYFEWTNSNGSPIHKNHCYRFIFKMSITSDRNSVSNWFRSNEDGAKLFCMAVQQIT